MMPEGPEVRTLVDQLQGGVGRRLLDVKFLSGRYLNGEKPVGFADFAATMTPNDNPTTTDSNDESIPNPEVDMILSWQAKGKFIYIILDDGSKRPSDATDFQRSIWITLGMTGKFVSEGIHAEKPERGRWYLEVQDIATQKANRLNYHDMRNFGTMKLCLSKVQLEKKLDSLGPDILEPSSTEETFLEVVAKKNPEMNVSKFLMNQANICGVGNYILADGLYRASIDPFASLKELSEPQQRLLFRELQSIGLESYAAQGMTRKNGGVYANVDGSKGQFEIQLQCYGRKFCPKGEPIIRDTSGPHGRTIWYTKDQLFMPLEERYQSTTESKPSQPKKTKSTLSTSKASVKAPAAGTQQDNGWNIWESPPEATSSNTAILVSSLSESGWKQVVTDEMENNESFRGLADFLRDEAASGQTIYPLHNDVFSALNLCPLEKVKVVVVGQDPYHGPGQGHGLSFSVRKGVPPPPSLKNIFNEAIEDVGIHPPAHGNLEHWAEQGVLMLNSVMTVRRGDANSHSKKGWEQFTDFIIQHLNAEKEGLVFLLYGNPAQKKANSVDDSKHVLIRTSHPSPLGARKTAAPFIGSRCFSRCNKALEEQGKDPIDWNV